MKKQVVIAMMFISSFALTGCTEDLLSSLCNRLAGSNSLITYFATEDDYSSSIAVLTYENTVTSEIYERSECESAFDFPNGDRKVESGSVDGDGIYFVSALDQVGLDFFSDENGLNSSDSYRVSISFHDSCNENGEPSGNSVGPFVSLAETINWQDAIEVQIPPELALVGECTVTGKTGQLSLSDNNLVVID